VSGHFAPIETTAPPPMWPGRGWRFAMLVGMELRMWQATCLLAEKPPGRLHALSPSAHATIAWACRPFKQILTSARSTLNPQRP
jgi:hypothetical protein